MTIQDEIIAATRGWIGTPYLHQQSQQQLGCDCLGLVRGVWRDVYGTEPELPPAYSASWCLDDGRETLAEAARRHMNEIPQLQFTPGDLLLFRWKSHLPARHAGIAVDEDRMVHAQDGQRVCEVALNAWWLRHLAFAFRFPARAA
jgi:NlpC/P60 family putative phage cell wall peptidase